ncbi:MAG TPA: hypothetical protein VEX41_11355 [Candidatus Eisenbacteria bacterium]|nr:hypothetical protein [Candidatus Eisenbacteria bacterium]
MAPDRARGAVIHPRSHRRGHVTTNVIKTEIEDRDKAHRDMHPGRAVADR